VNGINLIRESMEQLMDIFFILKCNLNEVLYTSINRGEKILRTKKYDIV
jgi:hypothetical protein